MFIRRLIWLTAYGWGGLTGPASTIGGFAGAMNGPTPMCYGFEAKFFSRSPVFGGLPVLLFFPWGVTGPDVIVPGGHTCNQIGHTCNQIGDFVPHEAMGDLVDDCFYWWRAAQLAGRVPSVDDYSGRAVEMKWIGVNLAQTDALATDATGTVGFVDFGGLQELLPPDDPVVVWRGRGRPMGAEPPVETEGLPVYLLIPYLEDRARALGATPDFGVTLEKCLEVRGVLRRLGCPVKRPEFPCLDKIARECKGIENAGVAYDGELAAIVDLFR
jgi:hypothetical protein